MCDQRMHWQWTCPTICWCLHLAPCWLRLLSITDWCGSMCLVRRCCSLGMNPRRILGRDLEGREHETSLRRRLAILVLGRVRIRLSRLMGQHVRGGRLLSRLRVVWRMLSKWHRGIWWDAIAAIGLPRRRERLRMRGLGMLRRSRVTLLWTRYHVWRLACREGRHIGERGSIRRHVRWWGWVVLCWRGRCYRRLRCRRRSRLQFL